MNFDKLTDGWLCENHLQFVSLCIWLFLIERMDKGGFASPIFNGQIICFR